MCCRQCRCVHNQPDRIDSPLNLSWSDLIGRWPPLRVSGVSTEMWKRLNETLHFSQSAAGLVTARRSCKGFVLCGFFFVFLFWFEPGRNEQELFQTLYEGSMQHDLSAIARLSFLNDSLATPWHSSCAHSPSATSCTWLTLTAQKLQPSVYFFFLCQCNPVSTRLGPHIMWWNIHNITDVSFLQSSGECHLFMKFSLYKMCYKQKKSRTHGRHSLGAADPVELAKVHTHVIWLYTSSSSRTSTMILNTV